MRVKQRTIRVVHYAPWLLGWSRWEVLDEIHGSDGMALRSVLASGSWKWRGRRAQYLEIENDAGPYWRGLPVEIAHETRPETA